MTARWEALAARLPDERDAALVLSPANRRYLTGFASSDGAVLVTREAGYFLTDSRYIEAAQRQVHDMSCVCADGLFRTVSELASRHGIGRVFIEAERTTLAERDRLQKTLTLPLESGGELDSWLTAMRLVKSPAELDKIRQAQALTAFGFDRILERIRPGRTEREIALDLEFLIRREGAEAVAFDFIVVSGPNSSLPHGVPSDRVVERGDLVTMDFGAVVDGWHSDMTRTVAVGCIGEEEKRVYDTVLEAQKAALAVLRAGLPCVQGDAAARDSIAAAGYGAYFGHGTGHGVGVEIHEAPRLSPRAGEECLAAGSVVTVEPGIYLPGRFGVRIEDMAFITETGCENLTACPKDLLIV